MDMALNDNMLILQDALGIWIATYTLMVLIIVLVFNLVSKA